MTGNEFPHLGGYPPGQDKPIGTLNKSWSSIASLNISERNKTNTMEIRLENEQGTSCSLNTDEIERLLRRLKIDSKQFTSVQACPERKNVVYITLCSGVDINKFIINSNESFILKPGIRTTTMKHASKREVNVQVFGLHPDTKDAAVIRYLAAHGTVNTKDPVTYGVYPGISGSSLLAGKRNGNRIYSMEVKKNIGSAHIIDGEKVSIKYNGQSKTCNKCHQEASSCPGKGLAKDCSADKILLSEHMLRYWNTIGFKPETTAMNDVDVEEIVDVEESIKTKDQIKTNQQKMSPENELNSRYGGVVIKGFKKDKPIEGTIEILKEAGLPFDYEKEDIQIVEKFSQMTIYVHDLKPETCIEIVNNLHGQIKLDNRISVFTLVEDTPTKALGETLEHMIQEDGPKTPEEQAEILKAASHAAIVPPTPVTPLDPSTPTNNPGMIQNLVTNMTSKFWNKLIDDDDTGEDTSDDDLEKIREQFKRKAAASPDTLDNDDFETQLTKKENKKLKKSLNKSS